MKAAENVLWAGPDPLPCPHHGAPFSLASNTSLDSTMYPSHALAGLAPVCQGMAPCPPHGLPVDQALGHDPSDP